jgi:hypothetical protein
VNNGKKKIDIPTIGRNKKFRHLIEIHFLIVFLIVLTYKIFPDEFMLVEREFNSPNRINTIYYKGSAVFGEGTFYVDSFEEENILVTLKIGNREPLIIWHENNVVEIKVSDGPYVHSYLYFFAKRLMVSLDYVIEVLPEKEIIVYVENLAKLNFRNFYSDQILQTISIDGLTGISLIYGGVRVKISDGNIICISTIEPFTYKELENPKYYVFKKEF